MPVKLTNTETGLDISSITLADISDVANRTERKLADVEQVFMTEADERVRPEHAALHGTVWAADDPNAPIPPLGEGCRCWLEFRAKDADAAKRTGLEKSPTKSPEPGDEALEQFWKDAKQSQQSATPGDKVTPTDTFGKTVGKAIEEKKIRPDEAIDPDTGNKRPASEVTSIANADNKRQVLAAITALQSMAITPAAQVRIVALAKEILIESPTLKDEQALFFAIMRLKPGRVAAFNQTQMRKNARYVAKQIRRAKGPLRG